MNIPLKSPSATEKNGPAPVWFHCNICSVQPSPDRHPKLTFFVSSCQHIYCNVCLHNFASSDACPLCQNKMKLVEFRKVGPNVVSMFESVLPGVKKTLIATQFQFKQAEHLVHFLNKQSATLKEDIDKNKERIKTIKEEVESIAARRELRKIEPSHRKYPKPDVPRLLPGIHLFDGAASAHSDFHLDTMF